MTAISIILLVILISLWYEIFKTRERVIQRCQQVCRQAELQFLDQTVAVVSVKFSLGRGCRPELRRVYQFEYSEDGVDRHRAFVDMVNNRIVSLRFTGPHGETIFHH